ncbi:hypothetical protein IQ269_21355 [Tychonema sp. LEGE 07199]|uniref:hypothetical protein n=1 Tax=unclassified Tychonema TaxID=2642144 RepID=UPI001881DFD7|nr:MULTISPECIES: hypothetical protein [unclassified Tychonema]MBE9123271.1 hypothetical protein [Tychonema sp. LEGE 07199]MBE9134892.1 hypothetical protein [Tychonema sp. LEGE 07196]
MADAASVRASRRYILVAQQALHAQISGQVLTFSQFPQRCGIYYLPDGWHEHTLP